MREKFKVISYTTTLPPTCKQSTTTSHTHQKKPHHHTCMLQYIPQKSDACSSTSKIKKICTYSKGLEGRKCSLYLTTKISHTLKQRNILSTQQTKKPIRSKDFLLLLIQERDLQGTCHIKHQRSTTNNHQGTSCSFSVKEEVSGDHWR